MAFTFNGIGTTYYGKDKVNKDQSYITTEWFVFFYLPVIPLRSYRLLPNQAADSNIIVYNKSSFLILEKLPIQWSQVLFTYATVILSALWYVFAFAFVLDSVFEPMNDYFRKNNLHAIGIILSILIIVLIIAAPSITYRKIRKARQRDYEANLPFEIAE